MTLSPLTSRARYLAIVLPTFALLSTAHGGCVRGPFGYGKYGIYGYGKNALERDLSPCAAASLDGGAEGDRRDCDEGEGDVDDGYGEPKGLTPHRAP
jgi:hypothetical protein